MAQDIFTAEPWSDEATPPPGYQDMYVEPITDSFGSCETTPSSKRKVLLNFRIKVHSKNKNMNKNKIRIKGMDGEQPATESPEPTTPVPTPMTTPMIIYQSVNAPALPAAMGRARKTLGNKRHKKLFGGARRNIKKIEAAKQNV